MMSTQPQPRQLIRRSVILERLGGASKSSGQRHVFSRPDFPKPVQLLAGVELYDEGEVDAWIGQLLAEREQSGE